MRLTRSGQAHVLAFPHNIPSSKRLPGTALKTYEKWEEIEKRIEQLAADVEMLKEIKKKQRCAKHSHKMPPMQL
jgi:hypothetical protein